MKIMLNKLFQCQLSLITLSLLLTSVRSLEESQPAIFLAPRNFNPHPFEAGYDFQAENNRVGPVVFPPAPPEENSANEIITVNDRKLNHPIDNHPYARVARKRIHKYPNRFKPHERNDINPRIYEALSNHAVKVLTAPASQLRKDYRHSSLPEENKNYAFSYKVVDHLTGDDFSHTQSQDSRATNGEYRVKLPDGRLQIVSYTADKDGYKADVKYTDETTNVQSNEINQYNYQLANPQIYTPIPTINYQSYNSLVTPKPFAPKSQLYFATGTQEPKVEIYSHNNRINGLGNYVASTVAPFLISSTPKTYHDDFHSSTVAPSVATYTPHYNLVY